ncbi:DUF2269 domain-containing protein [Paenibacillus sp. CC-CFT747]|nr:DUF2269 domain-containing protein [Paenibacillus sp. CC-CFT747]
MVRRPARNSSRCRDGEPLLLSLIRKSATTGSQLRFALGLIHKLDPFPTIGGVVLIVTGIMLMILGKTGLSLLWLNVSSVLLIVMVVLLIGFLGPRMKKATELVLSSQGEPIPAGYSQAMKAILPLEKAVLAIILAVIVLMVLKPF